MKKWRAFWAGAMASHAVRSLYEDYLGKDGVLAAVNSQWVDSSLTVPLAILMLVWAFLVYDPFERG